jgi:serine/threonine protein kinase
MARLTQLGKYQLIKRIAVGGMSEIYLASQGGLHNFERAVIVKCIRGDLDTDREVLDMFLDEARIAACLKHPNVVHLYDVGEDQGVPYLAMEYIFGRDLLQIAERVRALQRELPIQFVVKVMCAALAGLHYAHEVAEYEDRPLRVIHRDVSPQNIMVAFDGVPKLCDFGIAKAEARLSHTQAGVLKGKYAYMSPEQVRGKELDHRTDQFSLAVVFYEILTGTRLFQRQTDYSTMEAVDACEVPPLRVLRKDVPRRLVRVLRKAMRRNPKRRFKSCKDMERALHKLLKGSSVEQSDFLAEYMKTLFTTELKARDRAIRDAEQEQEREILMSTGFEMLDAKATQIGLAPPPMTANRRYEEILAERQGQQTAVRAEGLQEADSDEPEDISAEDDEDPDAIGTDPEMTQPRARRQAARQRQAAGAQKAGPKAARPAERAGIQHAATQAKPSPMDATDRSDRTSVEKSNPLADWRVLLLIFMAVLVGALALFTLFSDSNGDGRGDAPPSMNTARPGLDGFFSISVRGGVEVIVDGHSQGNGSFANLPLRKGSHEIKLKEAGQTKTLEVDIQANKETFISPDGWN